MRVTKKRLEQLRQKIIALRMQQSEDSDFVEQELGNLSRELLDITHPPKKGYVRFKTLNGWVSFKPSKKKKVGR